MVVNGRAIIMANGRFLEINATENLKSVVYNLHIA
jgi:hypothetical protein